MKRGVLALGGVLLLPVTAHAQSYGSLPMQPMQPLLPMQPLQPSTAMAAPLESGGDGHEDSFGGSSDGPRAAPSDVAHVTRVLRARIIPARHQGRSHPT